MSALAAKHHTTLTRIGGSVQITTGRRLSAQYPANGDDVVVMLDGDCAFANVPNHDVYIYWGAYLGTPDELLVSGRIADVSGRIQMIRSEARERKGWLMDTYLLRRLPSRTEIRDDSE
jgi:precorrin-6A synthase